MMPQSGDAKSKDKFQVGHRPPRGPLSWRSCAHGGAAHASGGASRLLPLSTGTHSPSGCRHICGNDRSAPRRHGNAPCTRRGAVVERGGESGLGGQGPRALASRLPRAWQLLQVVMKAALAPRRFAVLWGESSWPRGPSVVCLPAAAKWRCNNHHLSSPPPLGQVRSTLYAGDWGGVRGLSIPEERPLSP